jgi:hypothetical protein
MNNHSSTSSPSVLLINKKEKEKRKVGGHQPKPTKNNINENDNSANLIYL